MEDNDLRKKFGRFRILVIGRANAGKTTILKNICNSTEDPEIYDSDGNKVDRAQIQESRGRGYHNIENEMVFQSNKEFVFHDSCGFEAGSVDEFQQMKEFVLNRANTNFLNQRIHAIWYCISMDNYSRLVLNAEEKFFDECDTGNVPVLVVFTKCDALRAVAFGKLGPEEKQLPREEKLARVQAYVKEMLNNSTAWNRLQNRKYPPKSLVHLEDMHKSNSGCNTLLESTAAALNKEALQLLLVTTQQTNIMLCIKYAVKRELVPCTCEKYNYSIKLGNKEKTSLVKAISSWFPNVKSAWWRWRELLEALEEREREQREVDSTELNKEIVPSQMVTQTTVFEQSTSLQSEMSLIAWKQALHIGIDVIFLAGMSFFLRKHGQDSFALASEQYKSSGTFAKVHKALSEKLPQYGVFHQQWRADQGRETAEENMVQIIMEIVSQYCIYKL